MSAGPGVIHSEYNASKESPVHFLQIWILPKRSGLPSGYEQKYFSENEKRGRLRLVASPDGVDGSVRIQQDVHMPATLVGGGSSVRHAFGGRKAWLHVARGAALVNGVDLRAGDGAAIDGEETIAFTSKDTAEVLLFDFKG
jgi:quercetin 2,3-dioxygenase